MPETLKERTAIDKQFTWDLSRLFADDAAWEQALTELDGLVAGVAAFAGRLTDAPAILQYLEASTCTATRPCATARTPAPKLPRACTPASRPGMPRR